MDSYTITIHKQKPTKLFGQENGCYHTVSTLRLVTCWLPFSSSNIASRYTLTIDDIYNKPLADNVDILASSVITRPSTETCFNFFLYNFQ